MAQQPQDSAHGVATPGDALLGVDASGKKDERLLAACHATGRSNVNGIDVDPGKVLPLRALVTC